MGQRLKDQVDLDRIWEDQALAPHLVTAAMEWPRHVDKSLHESAAGRMVSERAKKPECWDQLRSVALPMPQEAAKLRSA
jgi:hypothetical protein